ncbi:ATP-binding protein [Marinoscillum pacificum]|uniref:ATP-binding protein n=1 Tax=Marinoscillum pacificum TaxID=392723 RepID=UPI0021580748|nr:ATP-binding protein [Marinoscillum pacificum]
MKLSNSAINRLNPFYVVVNDQKEIIEWGDSMGKLCPEIRSGSCFEEYFEIKKNGLNSDSNGIKLREEMLYFVTIKSSALKLKGQFILSEEEVYIFVGTPLIAEIKDLRESPLNLMDFPLHDYYTEGVFLLNEYERSNKEIQKFSDKLKERNQTLEEQHAELTEVRVYLEEINEDLEWRVKYRTKELEESNEELSAAIEKLKTTQNQLVESEKLAALGQLVAGIAHEINTPIGAIKASIELIHKLFLDDMDGSGGTVVQNLSCERRALFNELVAKICDTEVYFSSREERQFSRQMKNTLEEDQIPEAAFIASSMRDMGYFQDLKPYYALFQEADTIAVVSRLRDMAVQNNMAKNIKTSVAKVDKIVSALKTYISDQAFHEKREINLVESIDNVLTLNRNSIKQGVEVRKNFAANTLIVNAYADELNQVWINLIHNSLQAMENKGILDIQISYFDDVLFITIQDNGPGIPLEIQDKVFDPFFTTKKGGQGTGLGLALVKRIIEQHGGEIDLESEPGKTTLTITLPGLVRAEHDFADTPAGIENQSE